MNKVDKKTQEIAERLWKARIGRKAIAPLSEGAEGLNLDEAYQVSRINFERRLAQGERSLGRKIGLTSVAVQQQLGVSQPDFGYLTDSMELGTGAQISAETLLYPKVEGEVAFILAKALKGPGLKNSDIISAVDSVCVCIEIIDSRIQDWKIKIVDTVADNASSALFVLGENRKKFTEVDLEMAGMKLSINGDLQSTGVGKACLGHPVNAVTWLANYFGERGETLNPGDIILSGAYGPVVPVRSGDRCRVEINGLGSVECSFDG